MSFRLFIYYCALCGGWAAFLTWVVVWAAGALRLGSPFLVTGAIAAVLGLSIAGAVGALDAKLNAVGFQRFFRVCVCLVVGLVGGVFAGLIGETLHQVNGFLLFIGWILVGVAIGASIGVFDVLRAMALREEIRPALRKTLNGVYGGFLGGFLGGLLFELSELAVVQRSLPFSRLTVGLVILGLCIGLLIGLAQVVLKEAWLKVESGFRAGREVMLSKAETTIGRAEGNDLGLFGDKEVEKLHARILLKDSRYLIADAGTPGGTYLNDKRVNKPMPLRSGDAIRLGNCVLRFGERQKRC
jgi:hypothetical protein